MKQAPRTIEELIDYSNRNGADIDDRHDNDPAWQAGMRLEIYGDAETAIESVLELKANHWNTKLWDETQTLLQAAQGLAHWAAVERIVENHQAEKIEGTLVDAVTAGGLVALHDALNDTNAQRLRTEHIAIKVDILHSLMEKELVSIRGFTSART